MCAAEKGRKDVIELLLQNNASPDLQDKNGNTALMCAAQNGYTEIVQLLLEKQIFLDIKSGNNSDKLDNLLDKIFTKDDLYPEKGAVFIKIFNKAKDNPEMVKYLCDYFKRKKISFIDKLDKEGYNLLHHVAHKFTPEACNMLLEKIPNEQRKNLLQKETERKDPREGKNSTQKITPWSYIVARENAGGVSATKIAEIFGKYCKNNENKNWRIYIKKTDVSAAAGPTL